MSTYQKYRRNVYSQHGEDGVIEQLCNELQIRNGSFVEFGAWDGKYLSNTYHLLEQGWSGVYIEGDKKRFLDLEKNIETFKDKVTPINEFVEIEGSKSLDSLLASTDIPKDFDLLSIDIDSYDWLIWNKFVNYHPKIVVIEINSSIEPGIYQTHRDNMVCGSSFSSTVELSNRKGYKLVAHLGNLFFVTEELINRTQITEDELLYPELVFDYTVLKQTSYRYILPRIKNKLASYRVLRR